MTDMILYLHFNNRTGQVKMLQIPRNIFVTTDASFSGNYQINAIAKTQGSNGSNNISALADEIITFLACSGCYLSVRLEALTQIIDTFGGIQVYVPQDMDYGGSHLSQGYQTMDGAAAEFFLRTRHIYADSDLGRLRMQTSMRRCSRMRHDGMGYRQAAAGHHQPDGNEPERRACQRGGQYAENFQQDYVLPGSCVYGSGHQL